VGTERYLVDSEERRVVAAESLRRLSCRLAMGEGTAVNPHDLTVFPLEPRSRVLTQELPLGELALPAGLSRIGAHAPTGGRLDES
jgi:hypothetical protein